jgi:exosortase
MRQILPTLARGPQLTALNSAQATDAMRATLSGFGLFALAACLLWTYWPTLSTMADRWAHDAQYSHGFLVPVFAGALLWHRRALRPLALTPQYWGLAPLVGGVAIRLLGAYGGIRAIDAFSLLPTLAGICLLLGGWPLLRWTWPAIAFLGFMLPLPFFAETALAQPLQRLATLTTTYLLQTLGQPALAEGNIIYMDEVKLGVVAACSGLGMLMTFFALSTAVAIAIDRRLADKLVIVVSAIPIAVIANVVRITATGLVHYSWGQQAGSVVHDVAGWLMMPLALALLWLELQYLDRLLVNKEPTAPLPMVLSGVPAALPIPRTDAKAQPWNSRPLNVIAPEIRAVPTTDCR